MVSNNLKISILGCGWLGLPLAGYLKDKGFSVNGSTTRQEKLKILREKGIDPFQLMITDQEIKGTGSGHFFDAEILVINFPPKTREYGEHYHQRQMELLVNQLKTSTVKKVLFISSTSVYPDLMREVFEDETALPDKLSGKILLAVEQLLRNQKGFKTTVIRFGGLIGYDRLPGRFLAGKKNLEHGSAPVNVIHQDDCIELIHQIILQNVWGEVFNASCDVHPPRNIFYTLAAQKCGLPLPSFIKEDDYKFKIINSDKIKKRLGYHFKYPDPMQVL